MTTRRAGAALLILGAAACSESVAPPPAQRALGGEVVARAGGEEVGVDTVRRVSSAQAITPREALDRAIFDAVLAAEAKQKLSAGAQV